MKKTDFVKTESAFSNVIKPLRMVDLNDKKHCNVIVEVNFAPGKGISDKELEETTFLITWHNGIKRLYKMLDVVRFTLSDYYSFLTLPSYGMDFFDYYNWFKEQHPEMNGDTMMAGYLNKKL